MELLEGRQGENSLVKSSPLQISELLCCLSNSLQPAWRLASSQLHPSNKVNYAPIVRSVPDLDKLLLSDGREKTVDVRLDNDLLHPGVAGLTLERSHQAHIVSSSSLRVRIEN